MARGSFLMSFADRIHGHRPRIPVDGGIGISRAFGDCGADPGRAVLFRRINF